MNPLLRRAYARQRYFSWRILLRRTLCKTAHDCAMNAFYLLLALAALLALAGWIKG